MIRILDPASLTERAAASMVEVKESVSTWPQLASDVALGGAMVANAVRRIALGEFTGSGRFYADLDELTADGRQAPLAPPPAAAPALAAGAGAADAAAGAAGVAGARRAPLRRRLRELGAVGRQHAALALRGRRRRHPRVDRSRRASSLLDFRDRAALLALGAALEAAEIGARALGFEPAARPVAAAGRSGSSRCSARRARATRRPSSSCGSAAATAAPAPRRPIAEAELACARRPRRAARHARRGRRRADASSAAPWARSTACASSRPRLRHDMMGELRFTAAEALASRDGIEVASLELDGADRAAMDVLRTGVGMDFLADARPRLGPRQPRPRRVRRVGRGASCCAPRPSTGRAARGRPRADAAVARGDAPRARHPPVGLAVPVPAPARGPRLAGGVGAHRADARRPARSGDWSGSSATARSCSSCASRAATPPSVRSLRRPVDDVLAFAA